MATLDYSAFLEVAKNLPTEDILSMCQTQVSWRSFCQQPTFWEDLIFRSFGISTVNATSGDYTFLQNLYDQQEVLRSQRQQILQSLQEQIERGTPVVIHDTVRGPGGVPRPRTRLLKGQRKPYTEEEVDRMTIKAGKEIALLQEVISLLQEAELSSWKSGDPISYWSINPLAQDEFYQAVGVFFPAYTLHGAILQLNQFLPKHNLLITELNAVGIDDNSPEDLVRDLLWSYTQAPEKIEEEDEEERDLAYPYLMSFPKIQMYRR